MQPLKFLDQRAPQVGIKILTAEPIQTLLPGHHQMDGLPLGQGQGSTSMKACAKQAHKGNAQKFTTSRRENSKT
jgi:hypothetical protein